MREYSAAGVPIDGQRKLISSGSNGTENQPAIADLGSGNFVVTYSNYVTTTDGAATTTYDIAQQLLGTPAELARQADPVLSNFEGSVSFAENLVNATPQVIDPAVSLDDTDSANFAGGRIDLFYVQFGEATDQLGVRNQGNGFGQIGVLGNAVSYGGTAIGTIAAGSGANGTALRIDLSAGATVEAVEALIQNLTYGSTSTGPAATRTVGLRVSDGDGGTSAANTVTINVVNELDGVPVVHADERVNSYITGDQNDSDVAVLADGSYVVTWVSAAQDGNGTGVYAQRYTNAGVPIGSEFRVNTATTAAQDSPRVAGTSDGGFVITWDDASGLDTSGAGVVAQRYNAAGVAQGANFVVNTSFSSTQSSSAVDGYSGGFAVVWVSSTSLAGGADSNDIYLRRFDNNGVQVTAETRVSTTPGNAADAQNGSQATPDVAAYANGNLVIVWADQSGNDGNLYGVYGRRYDAATGNFSDTFLVNTTTTSYQYEPAVATLSDGGFVVVWRSDDQDASSAGVYAQRFDASGAKAGAELRINETTAGGQYQPDVTGLSTGGFVVTWLNDNFDLSGTGTTFDIYVREYNAAGAAIDGQRKLLSPSANGTENQPAIADLGSGNFVVTYSNYLTTAEDGTNSYDIAQQLLGSPLELARPSNAPVLDDVRILRTLTAAPADANFAGNAQVIDTDVQVSDSDSADFSGGQLLVNLLTAPSATEGLGVRNQGNAAGQIGVAGANVSFGGVQIGTLAGGGAGAATLTVTLNASANAAAVQALVQNITYQNTAPPAGTTDRYVSLQLSDGDGGVSTARQVQVRIQATFTPTAIVLDDVRDTIDLLESEANAGVLVDDAMQLDYSGPNSFNGGRLLATFISSTGKPEDQLSIITNGNGPDQVIVAGNVVSFGGTAIGTISGLLNGSNGANLEVTFNASATAQAVERVAESLAYTNNSEGPNASRTLRLTVSDSANVTSAVRDVAITVTPEADPAGAQALFENDIVNTFRTDTQDKRRDGAPVRRRLRHRVAITGQDGSGLSVHGQRFDAKGVPVGSEFQVATYTPNDQAEPSVAGLSGGGFVVTWRSTLQDGGGSYGVYAQRFDANGVPQGSEFRVNTQFNASEHQASIAGTADGGFVVAWYHDNYNATTTEYADIYFQRYNAAGVAQGIETQANTTGLGTTIQSQPSIAALTGGGFVTVWTDSNSRDGNGNGIFGQRFNADGTANGVSFQVNSFFTGDQSDPQVVGLTGGGHIVVWRSTSQDGGGSYGIYAQRYNAAGAAVGGEFRINTDTAGNEFEPSVTALSNGGFAVAFNNDARINVQQFDANGVRIDGETLVDTHDVNGAASAPVVLGLANGAFVVSFTDFDYPAGGGDNTYQIFQQVFGKPADFVRQANPELVDVTTSVTFSENALNAAPQLIDAAVGLFDADSANFAGGVLEVDYLTGYGAQDFFGITGLADQDQLGIRNEGNAAGQVGVIGSVVSYGGTAIGSIVSNGANGAKLSVQFNANATAEAVEQVIENLTYANTVSNPIASRTISIRVTDGDGGASAASTVQINVTPDADGAEPLFENDIVNTFRTDTQDNASMARLSDGGYVTVWQSTGQDGSGTSVHGQRHDAKGVPVGSEFQINTYTPGDQAEPVVAGLSGGGYVVAWRATGQDGGGSYGVYAQRFDANGVPQGSEFRVNTQFNASEHQASIAGTADGGFVVAWYHDNYNATTTEYADIYFQRYNAAGVAQGAETQANTTGLGTTTQSQPSIAALTGGGFVTVWTDSNSRDGNGNGVFGQRFNADGTANGSSFQVNTFTAGDQSDPQVVGLTGGGYIVVWRSTSQDGGGSYGIYAQRYNAAGSEVGDEFRINTDSAGNEFEPSVTALSNGGFAVAFNNDGRITAQQFDSNGERIDGEYLVDTHDANGAASAPTVLGLANGAFVVSFTDFDYPAGGGDNTYQIFQQVFGTPADFVRQANPELVDVTLSVTFSENALNAAPQLIDPAVGLFEADSANFDGGVLEVNYLTDYGAQDYFGITGLANQDQLGIRNEGNGPGQVGVAGNVVSYGGVAIGNILSLGVNGDKLTVLFNTNATADSVEQVIENLTYANTVSNPIASRTISIRVTDGDGGASAARTVQINITPDADGAEPLFDNDIVNTYRTDTQDNAAMARLSDGGYVTVWQSTGQDGWGLGIHGQRHDAKGVPVGSEFQVNTYTPNDQAEPVVAGLSGGGFVVAWRSTLQDSGSSYGVYAQRYDANGVPQGNEFLVNTQFNANEHQASIVGTADGGFVVAWYHDSYNATTTEYADIYFQRYNAAGVAQGIETQANTTGLGTTTQSQPSIAALTGGGFVTVWTDSNSRDGNSNGVFGQRFNADGTANGTSFQVNTFTAGDQSDPQVVGLTGGGYIVVWRSTSQDGGGSYGIYAQRYNAAGSEVGDEFRINTDSTGNEFEPSVTALSHGGFAVAFNNDGRITAQQFDANGVRIDGEMLVDTHDANVSGSAPAIIGLANGAFVVSFTDYDYAASGGDNTYQIFQQVFGKPADFVRQANPQLVDVVASITFAENTVNAAPQLIDPAVGLFDADSANFDGGLLEVDYLTGYGAQDQLGLQGLDNQDQLGIRNEGTGAGQVGVVGTTVTFGGTAIGTIVSNGANGDKLTVQFNANASVEAVEQVIENLTYANTVSNPAASRTVSIRVTDGDGGASEARAVQINVTPGTDGAVKVGLERIVNTTRTGTQLEPAVAKLADGGYVVVWEDQAGTDGSFNGVYGQRYDANDNAVDTEFRVNTATLSNQYEPQVVGLTGGGFVVVWRSEAQDGSGAGVYAQRYASNGTAAGGEFRVNTITTSNQYQPQVEATSSGGFVVTWYHDGASAGNTENSDVFFQRYDAAGLALGVETRANPGGLGTNTQWQPGIAWNADGSGFVVVWTDSLGDGSGTGVFGQRFNASGTTVGGRFQVNSSTESTQDMPSVAALKGGGFIVVWESEGQDLSSTGIYAQRFAADGTKVGAEFRVNTNITGQQLDPHVAATENGGWVVTWTDTNNPSDNSSYGIFAQQYNAAGQAIDHETRVNGYTFSTQQTPAITSMADGGFIVAYAGVISSGDGDGDSLPDGGNNTYEIRLQRFSNTAPISTAIAISANEEQVTTVTYDMFLAGYSDPEGQPMVAVKITTLPAEGLLKLNGVNVVGGQEISEADLRAGLLTYTGNLDFFGQDLFRWTASDGVAFAQTPSDAIVNVLNVNDGPGLNAGNDAASSEGAFFTQTITLSDPDLEGHQLTVNWGDGSAAEVFNVGSQSTHTISHRFYENGNYTVNVQANDQQGLPNSIETDTFQVAVANVAPTITVTGANTVVQGDTYTIDLGVPFDPANNGGPILDTVTEYRINWAMARPSRSSRRPRCRPAAS